MAWSEQASRGHLLFSIKYTAIEHPAFLFQPFFLACGWIASLTQLSIGFVHFLVKGVGVAFFFMIFFKFLGLLEMTDRQKILAALLVGLSSGLGWFLMKLIGTDGINTQLSGDLWIVDQNTFWSLLWNPLFPFSLGFFLLTIFFVERGTTVFQVNDGWWCGLSSLFLFLLHPYHVPVIISFILIVVVLRWDRRIWSFLWRCFSLISPAIIYLYLMSSFHIVSHQHTAAGKMASPHFIVYFLGFGLPGLLVLWRVSRKPSFMGKYWPLFLWIALSLTMSYIPSWFQRKSIFGVHIPICILCSIFLFDLIDDIPNIIMRYVFVCFFLFLTLPSNIFLLFKQRKDVYLNIDGSFYVDENTWQALTYLKRHTHPDTLVLSTENMSQFIPALAGNRVVWGHWAMCVDYDYRKRWFDDIFLSQSSLSQDQKKDLFYKESIPYVFADKIIKTSLTENKLDWLNKDYGPVFTNDSVSIFKRKT
jgi:hypothetical protein